MAKNINRKWQKNDNDIQCCRATIDVQAQPLMNHKIMKVKEHKDESHEFFYLFYL
jgi:hypothetical protein